MCVHPFSVCARARNCATKLLKIFDMCKYFDEKSFLYNLYCLFVLSISKCNLACNLVKVFEEAKFRCVKVQFFSGSVV